MSDATVPETRQPFHKARGLPETDLHVLRQRKEIIQRATAESLAEFLSSVPGLDTKTTHACVVGGGKADPASIANPHIRAHALEGQLFSRTLVEEIGRKGLEATPLLEGEAWERGAKELHESPADLKRALVEMGRATRPWRIEQKVAALGAWLWIAETVRLSPGNA